MGELVALETQNVEAQGDQNPGEDSVDFAAATTAALGVPSPCLSKTRSFDDSPPAAAELRRMRKGDLEEETELLQALQLSQGQGNDSAPNTQGDSTNQDSAFTFSDATQTSPRCGNISQLEQFKSDDGNMIKVGEFPTSITIKNGDLDHDQLSSKESGDVTGCDVENVNSIKKAIADETSAEAPSVEKTNLESAQVDSRSESLLKSDTTSVNPGSLCSLLDGVTSFVSLYIIHLLLHFISLFWLKLHLKILVMKIPTQMPTACPDFSCRAQEDDVPNTLTSPISTDEPMYEGEECVNAVAPVCADKEPVYEGESLLGKRAEKNVGDCSSEGRVTDGLTAEEGNSYSI